ncbi:hypothetical protein TNCV_3731611, partial [Trichonephila clavipes]
LTLLAAFFTAEAVAIYRALQLIDSTMPRKYCIYTDSIVYSKRLKTSPRLLPSSAVPTDLAFFQQALTDSWSRMAVHVSKGEKQEKRCLERPFNLGETLA